MVTSQKISEKKMDYRGSNSVILKHIAVKEQRLYVNRYGNILPCLRFTLMDFKKNYQIKNHSNQIIQRQLFSKKCKAFEEP